MIMYGLNENLRCKKSLQKGANFRLSPTLIAVQLILAKADTFETSRS